MVPIMPRQRLTTPVGMSTISVPWVRRPRGYSKRRVCRGHVGRESHVLQARLATNERMTVITKQLIRPNDVRGSSGRPCRRLPLDDLVGDHGARVAR